MPEPKEHLITPATVMTASRPVIAAKVGQKLIKGEPGATPLFIGMALTDMEGKPAGLIDAIKPGTGYGRTEFGTSLDPITDSIAFAEVGVAALASPRVSRVAKVAVGIVLATEGVKGVWAIRANAKHKKETGKQLVIRPDLTGKTATALKFKALLGAVRTHDLEPGRKRTAQGMVALGSAVIGAVLGEKARRGYKRKLGGANART